MPRYDSRPRRSGLPAWVWVLIALVGVVLLCGGTVVGSMFVITTVGPPAGQFLPTAGSTPTAAKTYTRDEFKALVDGKTEAEVIAAVGSPDQESGIGPEFKGFSYYRRTVGATGKPDTMAIMRIKRGGRVEQVTFHDK